MTTLECRELLVLRSLGAAGALEGDDAARLAVHLEQCPTCRAAERRERELLDLVRLPAPGAAEALAVADLPARALTALRRRERRHNLARRFGVGTGVAAVAAAALLVLLGPALFRTRTPDAGAAQVAQAGWQVPDADALWTESEIVDFMPTSAQSGEDGLTDAALAAYDAGAGE
jgi:hypothetical protein